MHFSGLFKRQTPFKERKYRGWWGIDGREEVEGIFGCKRLAQCLLRSQGAANILKRWPSSALSRSLAVSGIDIPGKDYREQAGSVKYDSTAVYTGLREGPLLLNHSSSCRSRSYERDQIL